MKVAVKHLEGRIDDQGNTHILEAGSKPPEKSKEDKWAEYILCELRHFDYNQKFTHRTLEIKSDQLKELLRNMIGDYPGNSFKTPKIKLNFPLRCLYHYLDEMAAKLDVMKAETSNKAAEGEQSKKDGKKKGGKRNNTGYIGKEKMVRVTGEAKSEIIDESIQQDPEAAIEHLEFFIHFIKNEFQETITDCNNLLPHGFITYD